ncbi:MAG: hypothetical protein HY671_14850 [Chloroflexi bacterium]|nr:hypothetical protein [Chloroflexota bacterium]
MEDFRQYYDLESYLLDVVRSRFKEQGSLSAFDFFCIVIWKANRTKSTIARKLLGRKHHPSLDDAVHDLTRNLAIKASAEERFGYLWNEWHLRGLPMVSAILTILYPDEFTVYDIRVCGQLEKLGKGKFSGLNNLANFEKLWSGYQQFRRAVEESTPQGLSLRDKDRYLFGKSFHKQLTNDLERRFEKAPDQRHEG